MSAHSPATLRMQSSSRANWDKRSDRVGRPSRSGRVLATTAISD
jgi:hypothetical protein